MVFGIYLFYVGDSIACLEPGSPRASLTSRFGFYDSPKARLLDQKKGPHFTASGYISYILSMYLLPGPPKVCFLEVFSYIKPTKKHTFGGPGICCT